MKILRILGVVLAVVAHVAFLLFGGLLFGGGEKKAKVQRVDLVSTEDLKADEQQAKEEKKVEEKPPEPEEVRTEQEAPPQSAEMVAAATPLEPALEAASLGALEAALNGAAGDQGFGGALSLASGGRIGGTGRPGATGGGGSENQGETAFSMAEIDQKPRPVFQVAPTYPAELRSRKAQGEVWLQFVVDHRGRVGSVRVEKSSHPAFARPAVDAVKQWKFDPAMRGGQKVACRMRLPIRFTLG